MIAIVPIVAGVALGLTAPRRTAVAVQSVLYIVAAVVLVVTAPQHDSTTAGGALFALGVLPLAALSLGAGLLIRARRDNSPAPNSH